MYYTVLLYVHNHVLTFTKLATQATMRDCRLLRHAHFPCETGFVVVATTAYMALETETTVR